MRDCAHLSDDGLAQIIDCPVPSTAGEAFASVIPKHGILSPTVRHAAVEKFRSEASRNVT